MWSLVLVGCHRTHEFESVCQIVRRDVVEANDGGVTQVDVELEWDPCPGDQFQVIRGNGEFAACIEKYKIGYLVPVEVKHWWDDHGYYTWDLSKVGDCPREIEDDRESSYEKSQECSDVKSFGKTVGFDCNRRPFKKLVSICPWMER